MHEADKYALINDATSGVENVILHCPDSNCPDHPTPWSPPEGYSLVKLDPTMPPVSPGDVYDGKVFKPALVESEEATNELIGLNNEDIVTETPISAEELSDPINTADTKEMP